VYCLLCCYGNRANWLVCCRYKLPIVFIVMNNNGIGFGADSELFDALTADSDATIRYFTGPSVSLCFVF